MAGPTTPLPVYLTYAESVDLRKRVENAIADARDAFINCHVARDMKGTPIGGPDPRAADAEMVMIIARWLVRQDLDIASVAAFEAKIARLEAEVARLTGVASAPVAAVLPPPP